MAEERLDRIEAALEQTTVLVNRLVRYAMLIARIHEDELASLKNRVRLLEEGLNGDVVTG